MPAADAIRKDELLSGSVYVMDIVHIHYQFSPKSDEIESGVAKLLRDDVFKLAELIR